MQQNIFTTLQLYNFTTLGSVTFTTKAIIDYRSVLKV